MNVGLENFWTGSISGLKWKYGERELVHSWLWCLWPRTGGMAECLQLHSVHTNAGTLIALRRRLDRAGECSGCFSFQVHFSWHLGFSILV